MGIASILGSAARYVSWAQVANMALQYGPEILKKIKEHRQQPAEPEEDAGPLIEQLQGRIAELESSVISQQEIIDQQARTVALLEEMAKTLQARLKIAMATAAVFGLAAVVLLILLLKNDGVAAMTLFID